MFSAALFRADAQGGWDMKYIPLDSVSDKVLGKEIRIDFKSNEYDTLSSPLRIRMLLRKADSARVLLHGDSVMVRESWKIHVDEGFLKRQQLVLPGRKDFDSVSLSHLRLIGYSENELFFDIRISHLKPSNSSRPVTDTLFTNTVLVAPRKSIKGLLISED